MEVELPSSQLLNYPIPGAGCDDTATTKYLADISTVLVATIQEAKDRISQVEFIFCSRLFPGFLSQSKSLRSRIAEATESAKQEWLERETSLVRQIEDIRNENGREVKKLHRAVENLGREKAEMARRHEAEREVLMAKLEGLQKSEVLVAELREKLGLVTAEAAERKEMQERLLRQIDAKEEELVAERGKRRRMVDGWKELSEKYKHVRSQYRFLLRKSGLVEGEDRLEGDIGFVSPVTADKRKCQVVEEKDEEATALASDENDLKNDAGLLEKVDTVNGGKLYCNSDAPSVSNPSHATIHANKCPRDAKPGTAIGAKRSTSSWRDTRANQEQRGFDPHDDFLDTPMENVKESLKKLPSPDEVQVAPNDMDLNNSDDETQDATDQPLPKKQLISIQKPGNGAFKYIAPVRKKAERENLKGVECKQCKKFYDAVLPDGNKNDNSINSVHCEHHEGVSRHRYRYVPPSTPEGFWNIGFDSDM